MTTVRRYAIERVIFLFALMVMGLAVYLGAPLVHECGIGGAVIACMSVVAYLEYFLSSFTWASVLLVSFGLCGFLPIRLTRRTIQLAAAGEVLVMLAYVIFVALQPTPNGCGFQ
jgi:hypothetical protein